MMECVNMEDNRRLTELRFDAAVKVIKSLPPDGSFQPSNDMMLRFYSFYKQATVGPCNTPRPGFWDAVGKAKWDAWSSLGDMPKEEAMSGYVDEMKLILEGMPITDEVEQLLRVLGPFYELVDEKKKISQISDLSTGFGTMITAMPSKSVTKSIIRNMEMNGTLEARPARAKPTDLPLELSEKGEKGLQDEDEEEEEDYDDDEEEEEEDEEEDEEEVGIREVKTAATSQPKKKGSARRPKVPLSNGKVTNGVAHLTNGSLSKATLNSEDSQDGSVSSTEPQLNGHHTDPSGDVSGPHHLASDSDSEVYCDSVDQFGQEESSEQNCSLDDLDEEENQIPPSLEEPQAPHGAPEEPHNPPEGIQCGGEDGETSGEISQRQRLNSDRPDSSLVRRGRGSRSSGLRPRAQGPMQGSGDGEGERWGRAGTPGASLNEQIMVALARLQEDMQSVLERLHTLEALTATQARTMALSPTYALPFANKGIKKPTWWPFDVSPNTVAFVVIWPLVVQWLMRLYFQRRRRIN